VSLVLTQEGNDVTPGHEVAQFGSLAGPERLKRHTFVEMQVPHEGTMLIGAGPDDGKVCTRGSASESGHRSDDSMVTFVPLQPAHRQDERVTSEIARRLGGDRHSFTAVLK
jgi:hypothetical protein